VEPNSEVVINIKTNPEKIKIKIKFFLETVMIDNNKND
jgi:hypothetical protein